MKDNDPKPDPWPSRVLLAFNILAWAGFIVITLPARHRYDEIFTQMGMKKLPAPTEFFLLPPDFTYGIVWSLPAILLMVIELSPLDPSLKVKANIAALVGVFLAYGLFLLAVRMPLHAVQTQLGK